MSNNMTLHCPRCETLEFVYAGECYSEHFSLEGEYFEVVCVSCA